MGRANVIGIVVVFIVLIAGAAALYKFAPNAADPVSRSNAARTVAD